MAPVVRGLENLPKASDTNRPLLLVGNHARIGLYDMPFLVIELYMRRIKVPNSCPAVSQTLLCQPYIPKR